MSQNQPNILLITTDQQRFDAAGDAGPAFLRTPHYDNLCREGIAFERAYADCPVCVPARVGIMSGQTVFTHGMDTNGETSDVLGRDATLPALLRAQGYQTCAVGKMHFGPMRARHGFDEMILPADYYQWMERSGHPQQPMRHGLGQNELYPGMATVPESLTLTNWIAQQCVEYIKERRDPTAPFFLWCSFSHPHPPLDPPEPYYSMYRDCDIPAPVFGDWSTAENVPATMRRHREQWSCDLVPPEVIREARAAYYGLITQIDYNLGRVFAALQDHELFNETLILYTSDHGEFLGDHHTGGKSTFHEPSAHVPFALRLPHSWENRQHGARLPHLVTHADILPTLLAAAGGTPPPEVEGQNLIALARGEIEPRTHLEATVVRGQYFAITNGRWKYIYYPEGAAEQLFDVENDPQELTNLAGKETARDIQQALKAEMIRRHEARNSECVEDGKLLERPLQGDTTADRRNRPWPGYHTERYHIDVCH